MLKTLLLLVPYLHDRRVFYSAIFASGLLLAYYLVIGPFGSDLRVVIGIPALAVVGGIVLFELITKLPVTKPGSIGVVFAIVSDDAAELALLRSDFSRVIKRTLAQAAPGRFQFLDLPDRHARRILTNEIAGEYMMRTQSHFLFFGDIRKGKESGKEWHALRLNCAVRHVEIPPENKKQLSKEMAHVLPPKVLIACENDRGLKSPQAFTLRERSSSLLPRR